MKREDNKYRILYLSRYIAEFLFYQLLSAYLNDLNFSGTQTGIILSVSPIILTISLPLWMSIDKGVKRKILMSVAAAILITMQFLMLIPRNFPLMLTFAMIYSVARAPLAPSIDSLTSLYALENKKEFSKFRAFGSLGYIIAIILGSIVYERSGFLTIAIISSVFFVVVIICSLAIKPLHIDSKREEKGNIKELLTNKKYIGFLFIQAILYSTLIVNTIYELLYIKERKFNLIYFGVATAIRVVTEIIVLAILARRKNNYKYLFIITAASFIPQSLVFFFNGPLVSILLIDIFAGLGSGGIVYLNNKYLVNIVKPRNVTLATYLFIMVQNISIAIMLVIGGKIIDIKGIRFVFLATAIIFMVSLIFIFMFIKHPTQSEIESLTSENNKTSS